MNVIKEFSTLLKEPKLIDDLPIVIRVNKFDEASARSFSNLMTKAQNTGQPIVPIVIDSYGGQVYSLMSMVSDINSSRVPVATIVQGKAMSCGALLFSLGAEGHRYMDTDSTIMIHDVSSMSWGKVEEIEASAKETSRLNKKVYQMMAQNCGKRKNYFLDLIHEKGHADWFLDADEAVKHNLANHIKVPELQIKAEVNFTFE